VQFFTLFGVPHLSRVVAVFERLRLYPPLFSRGRKVPRSSTRFFRLVLVGKPKCHSSTSTNDDDVVLTSHVLPWDEMKGYLIFVNENVQLAPPALLLSIAAVEDAAFIVLMV